MTTHEYVLGLVDPSRAVRRPPVVGMAFLHETPMRPSNVIASRVWAQSERLIGLLFGHVAGGTSAGTIGARVLPRVPRVKIALACRAPSGEAAVKISL